MASFTSFAPSLQFLKEIETHNHRDWFQANKDRYQDEYLPPIQAFIEAIGVRLKEVSPGLNADPRPSGGSMMRIYRDIRFSKDKTPYKTHLGITFWEGAGKKTEVPGYHFYMDKSGAVIYGGQHSFPKSILPVFRAAIDDEDFGPQFQPALDAVAASGDYEVGGEQYVRVPREFDPEHPRGDQLRFKGIYVKSQALTPDQLTAATLIDLCIQHFQNMAPLHHWLVKMNSRA
jgi:uncharacterized protein (TIGR02453 family)